MQSAEISMIKEELVFVIKSLKWKWSNLKKVSNSKMT